MGPRYDMGKYFPGKEADGWFKVASGKDWAVWEKRTVAKPF